MTSPQARHRLFFRSAFRHDCLARVAQLSPCVGRDTGIPTEIMIASYLKRIGFLRAVLMFVTLLLVLLAPFAGGYVQTSGWRLITTLIAPVSFVIFFFILCLDMLMTRLFMSERSPAERQRLVMILRSEAVLLVVLVSSWLPFVLDLLRMGAS